MRELDRTSPDISPLPTVAIVGDGRLGRALARALAEAGHTVVGPLGRGETAPADIALLCVPDAEIEAAAGAIAGSAPLVGHTSGAPPLSALEPAGAEAFGLHPLQTFNGAAASFEGCSCAIAGTTDDALSQARSLASALGMHPFVIDDGNRAAYHAAASVASNFFVTLMAAAESLAEVAGIDPEEARAALVPLLQTTLHHWAASGPEAALTGPIARGDSATVEAQRSAIASQRPELLALFDALAERTRALARAKVPVSA